MTTFEDGPAKGQHLALHEAKKFLRVTEEAGKFDALDRSEDTPRPTEKLYAYRIVERPGMCHIRMANRKASGFYALARYRLVEEQPADEIMRDAAKWVDWCKQNNFEL